jgi:phenylpropionate dioxygenase-like ring-hydroxylating dioxygenase large terminal subunit
MIRNQWYVVLESKEVKTNRPVGVTRLGEKLVFWRDSQGKVSCMRDLCPHLGALLSQGKVLGDALACPFHGFEFDKTGQCTYLPAYGRKADIPKALKVGSYLTYEAHDYIWIWWGDPALVVSSPKWFEDIDSTFSFSGFHETWPVHYSRMAENQLDVVHLPFVHYNTIGRGQRCVVDGPILKLEEDVLSLWVSNRVDDGTPPRKAQELPAPTRPPSLIFNFPNLWQNRIAEDYRLTAAFIPVDEENSIINIRSWQRTIKIPILREIFNLVSVLGSIYITHQDRHVVLQQAPKKTELKKMGEKLTQADTAILTYRTHRHALKVKNGQIEE